VASRGLFDHDRSGGHRENARVAERDRPLRLIRRGRFLGTRERWKLRLHRLRTGNVLFFDSGEAVFVVLAYAVRLVTLPVVAVADVVASPILRWLDRNERSWWVVEVRFDGWDAEVVRVAEASSRHDAQARLKAMIASG
jgi:hypothetical protein